MIQSCLLSPRYSLLFCATQLAQQRTDSVPRSRVTEPQADLRFQQAERGAHVVTPASELIAEQAATALQDLQSVGELDFAAHTRAHFSKNDENLRRQDVAADNGEVRRAVPGGGFSTRAEIS